MRATLLLLLKLGFNNRHKSFSTILKHGSFKGNHKTYFADIINFLTLKLLKKCLSKLSKLKKVLIMIWKRFLLAKLDEQALSKAKFLRHGDSPFMAKENRTAIMKRKPQKSSSLTSDYNSVNHVELQTAKLQIFSWQRLINILLSLLLHNVPKWSYTLAFAARFWKCAWPFWDVMY